MGKASRRKKDNNLLDGADLKVVDCYDWQNCDILDIDGNAVMVWRRDTNQIAFVWLLSEWQLDKLFQLAPAELKLMFRLAC